MSSHIWAVLVLSRTWFRARTSVSLCACLTIIGTLSAQTLPSNCLAFRPMTSANGEATKLQGKLLNKCGRPVSAYSLAVSIAYIDGSISARDGLGEDFLAGRASLRPGVGSIQPDEERTSGWWAILGPAPNGAAVKSFAASVNAIIFDDSSAIGDSRRIDTFFQDRRDDLRELRFWQQSLSTFKPQTSESGSLLKLMTLANVPQREKTMRLDRKPRLIESHAQTMRGVLGFLDASIQSGRMTRAEALQSLEQDLARQVSAHEKNAYRRK